jgi:hypothetical protein
LPSAALLFGWTDARRSGTLPSLTLAIIA